MRKRFVAMLACVLAALLLLPATAFADVFTITIPERSDAIVSVTVGGVKYEEGETISVEAGAQVSAQAMQYSSTGSMFTGWSVTPEGSLALEDTKIVKFTMPEQNITLEPVIKQFEANAGVDANGVLTWEEPVAGYVSRVYVLPASSSDAITSRVAESGWVSAEQGRYTVDVRELLEEQADADELSEGAEYSIYLEYVANEAELSPNGIRGSYFNAATYTYHAVDYHLAVGRVDVTSQNATDVLGDGTVSYDPDTQTLTLNGAKVTQGEYKGAAIYCETGNLGIELVGDNRVVGPDLDSGNPVYSRGIYVYDGTLNISGDGSLTVEGGDVSVSYGMAYSYGIWAAGNVEISSGTVSATGGDVSNGNGTGGSYGISANQDILISGGNVVVTGGEAETLSYGAYAALGDISLAGGNVTATSGQVGTQIQPESHALYGSEGVVVEPPSGERVSVVAGKSEADASALEGSPFETIATITDLVDEQRYVKVAASSIPVVRRYDIWVEGIQVTSGNASDVLGDADEGTTVAYDAATNTLTLDHAHLSNPSDPNQYPLQIAESGVVVKLVGENTVSSAVENVPAVFIVPSQGGGETRIVGDGAGAKLTVTSDVSGGIQVDAGDLIVRDCTLFVRTEIWEGLLVNHGALEVRDAEVDVASSQDSAVAQGVYVIRGENGIVFEDSTVTALNGAPGSNVIYSGADLTVDGSEVTATGTADNAFPAVYAAGNVHVTDGSNVNAASEGMRGIYAEADMTVEDSVVTATGATNEGMVVAGALSLSDGASVAARTVADDGATPALVTQNLSVDDSELTACGGVGLFNWNDPDDMSRSFSIVPASGKLMEFKVDDENTDGSSAVHFSEWDTTHVSPYDVATELNETEMNWLGAYRYVHIGAHVHAGGVATCATPAICDDCGREYGAVDPDAHSFTHYVSNNDATCTQDGTETATCDNGCGATDTRVGEGTARGHDYVDGVCTVCGAEDPGYAAADGSADDDSPKDGGSEPTIPATGDPSLAMAAVPAAAGLLAVCAGAVARRRM